MKKIMMILICLTVIVGALVIKDVGGKNNDKNKDKQVGLNIVHANYSYNVKSLTDTVKFMDCIFVGKVKSIDGYCYEAPIVVDGKSGEEVVYDTYTNYEIEILSILKGNIQRGTTICVKKRGGLERDGKSILIMENDVLPDVGEKYLFMALKQEDGSLLLSGEASNISLNKYKDVKKILER